jgi:hypothetical protein
MKTRGIIVGRTNPPIQLCPKCGSMRIHHPGARLYECPVTADVLDALRRYRDANGKRWKSLLTKAWEDARQVLDMDPALLRAKSLIGPRRLYKVTL